MAGDDRPDALTGDGEHGEVWGGRASDVGQDALHWRARAGISPDPIREPVVVLPFVMRDPSNKIKGLRLPSNQEVAIAVKLRN